MGVPRQGLRSEGPRSWRHDVATSEVRRVIERRALYFPPVTVEVLEIKGIGTVLQNGFHDFLHPVMIFIRDRILMSFVDGLLGIYINPPMVEHMHVPKFFWTAFDANDMHSRMKAEHHGRSRVPYDFESQKFFVKLPRSREIGAKQSPVREPL